MRGEKSKEKDRILLGGYQPPIRITILGGYNFFRPKVTENGKGGLMEWILRHTAVVVAVI